MLSRLLHFMFSNLQVLCNLITLFSLRDGEVIGFVHFKLVKSDDCPDDLPLYELARGGCTEVAKWLYHAIRDGGSIYWNHLQNVHFVLMLSGRVSPSPHCLRVLDLLCA